MCGWGGVGVCNVLCSGISIISGFGSQVTIIHLREVECVYGFYDVLYVAGYLG